MKRTPKQLAAILICDITNDNCQLRGMNYANQQAEKMIAYAIRLGMRRTKDRVEREKWHKIEAKGFRYDC